MAALHERLAAAAAEAARSLAAADAAAVSAVEDPAADPVAAQAVALAEDRAEDRAEGLAVPCLSAANCFHSGSRCPSHHRCGDRSPMSDYCGHVK